MVNEVVSGLLVGLFVELKLMRKKRFGFRVKVVVGVDFGEFVVLSVDDFSFDVVGVVF